MNSEDKYREMPDRSHYIACSDRLTQIKQINKRAFYYTFFVALFLAAGSAFNIRYNILSLLPDLAVGMYGDGTIERLFAGMLQLLTAVTLIIIAYLGTSSRKFCHVFLFAVYLAMPISCLMDFGARNSDAISLCLGIAGSYFYFPTLKAWYDYRIISHTEGFPYFSERFATSLENKEYKSEDYNEEYADEELEMNEVEKELTENLDESQLEKKEVKEKVDMEIPSETPVEIPHRGDSKKNREKKKSSLELARELAEKANKFDFEIDEKAE